MRLVSRYRVFVAALCVLIGLSAIAMACNVPVFRFALERWRADAYCVVLFHRGPLSEQQRELIRPLEQAQDRGSANLTFQAVDVSQFEKLAEDDQRPLAALRDQVWSRLGEGEAKIVVQYPEHLQIAKPVWVQPLNAEVVGGLIDSPVRQELVSRLAKGQTAVSNHQYPFDHPVSGFGIYCVRCHASTKTRGETNEYTFASLRNIAGFRHESSTRNSRGSPGYPATFRSDANVYSFVSPSVFVEAWQRTQ